MRAHFRLSDLIPAKLNVEAVHHRPDVIVVVTYGKSRDCRCPECGTTSHRVHSRYPRMISDLPCAGRRIELHLTVRRFVCSADHCRRKIFAERFGDDIVRPMARRTARLDTLVRHLALALGGRPAARFVDRLGFPVSNDTLLRTVRRYDRLPPTPPSVIGIARSSATLSGERRSSCCPTGNRRLPRPGPAAPDRDRRTRPRRQICAGRHTGPATCRSSRRPLASDGER